MASISPRKLDENQKKAAKHKSNTSRQRAAPAGPTQEIAFVNLTDSSGPIQDAAKRKLVRAHVMRGYQRQKQAREEEGFEKFAQGRQQESKAPLTSIIPLLDSQSLGQDTMDNTEPTFTEPFNETDWTTTLDFRPNQARPEAGRIFGQQVEGEWVPVTVSGLQENQPMTMDTTYDIGNANFEHSQSGDAVYGLSSLLPDYSSQYFGEPEFVPEQIECPLISRSLTLSLSFSTLNSGMLDPFNAMPGLKNARAQALMYHYNKVLVNTLIPVNPKDKWFNYAISDEALFHATMLHSAGHNAMLAGNNNLADPFQLKLEAIRLVNQRLDDPVRSISDLTIGAVACLVLFENQSGNVEVSNIHMEGLRRMINLRGGLQNLGLSGVLQRKVLWAEVCNAMLSLSKPQLNLPQVARTHAIGTASIISEISSYPFIAPLPDPRFMELCSCDKQLTEIIIDLRKISDEPPINALDGAITDHLYLVERHLVTLLEPRSLSRHSVSCRSINRPCFIAALTYIYTSLRDFPIQAPLFTAFIERLSSSLFIIDFGEVWKESSYPMLLWVLTVGGIASSGRPERNRFVAELERVAEALGVRSFEEFMGALRKIVWRTRSDDGGVSWRTLWDEVEEIRRVRLEIAVSVSEGRYHDVRSGGEDFYELF